MTEDKALLMAVLANPADDLPRKVFADWLDEHGDLTRAEFIRTQCAVAEVEQELSRPYRFQTECTELSANWCGVCGDCCCPSPEESKNDSNCPLHSPRSRHSSDDSLRSVLLDLTTRESELWTAGGHGMPWPRLAATMTLNFFGRLSCHRMAVYRRGFVDEVVVPTVEVFIGRECDACDGPVGHCRGPLCTVSYRCGGCECDCDACSDFMADRRCLTCGGSGLIGGHLDIVKQHPVRRVSFGEVNPLRMGYENGEPRFYWRKLTPAWTPGSLSYALPPQVFLRLKKGKRLAALPYDRQYTSAPAADDDLSDAVLSLAKEVSCDPA